MLSAKNKINNFIKFDKKIICLDDKKIIELWISIRYAVFYNLVSDVYFSSKKKSFLKKISKFIFQILQTIKIIFFIFKRTKILEIDVGRHKIYEKNQNSTINYILKKNNINAQTISISSNSKIFDNKINISFVVNIIHFFLKFFIKFNKNSRSNLFLIEKKFNSFFKIKKKVNFLNIYQSIYLQQVSIYITIKFFIKLFGAKKIIYLENPSLTKLIQYCGKNSIETFDVQHSMVSKLNILYRFYVNKKYNYLITNKIIIWGNYWKKFYSHNNRCVSIGYLENYVNYKKIKKIKQVVIISSIFSRKYLIDLLKFLSINLKDYKIIYKLRPEENFNEIKDFIKFDLKNVSFLRKISEKNLKKIIAQSQYIIGVNSTLLAESIGKSNVIVYKKGWFQEYEDLIKENILFLAKNCNDVLTIIKNKKKLKNTNIEKEIFKLPNKNSFKNLLRIKKNV